MLKHYVIPLSLATSAFALSYNQSSTWSGWSNVKYLIIFGDSYTQTGFNVSLAQPSISNPLGNPTYPGWTSSNGPNCVDFLTFTYNESIIQTYNLAYGGATVDSALVAPYAPTVLSVKDQVQGEFIPHYASSHPWNSSNSLVAFFIGINDVGNSWWLNNGTLYDKIFSEYQDLVGQVYQTGARNFLFLNVPPVNLAPLTLANGDYAITNEGLAIQNWNWRILNLTATLKAKNQDITTFVHDTHSVFTKIIADPKSYPQTSGLKNVTGYCAAYQNGTPDWYTFDQNCTYPVNEYLWLNTLHPTFPTHNATAADIVAYLKTQT